MNRPRISKGFYIILGFVPIGFLVLLYLGMSQLFSFSYVGENTILDFSLVEKKKEFIATHVKIPEAVKAVYMSACAASASSFRDSIVPLIEDTELNAVVIDIKDYSGSISFATGDSRFDKLLKKGCFVPDMREFIASLHAKGIYVIGRITVFQDPQMANARPDLAVQKKDKTVWKDFKGLSFIDVGASEFWDYIVALGISSYKAGFDELNFDYIRFPSDGNMNDIYYPLSEERLLTDPDFGKAHVLEEFFSYLKDHLAGTGVVISADLFGMTTTNTDDLNIGQVLERALPYFDYIAPMVYPSHYPKTFLNLQNPAAHPYEVVKFSLDSAVTRASTTSQKIRPWLQDFDLGAVYTKEMVRAQIQATYDAGLTSWMLWDAANTYTEDALLPN
ncbi:MAG: putative glycoside hydrolase [Patescibacteria group bacterium]